MKLFSKHLFTTLVACCLIFMVYGCTPKDVTQLTSIVTSGLEPTRVNTNGLKAEQAQLKTRLISALIHMLTAQEKILDATNDKEKAAAVANQITVLESGNVTDEELNEIVASTKANNDNINEKNASMNKLDQSSKEKIGKALIPYSLGVVDISKVNKDFTKWLLSAQTALSSTSVTNLFSLKKDLNFGMSIAPKLPSLTSQTFSTSQKLISFCKCNKLKTSDAEDYLGDIDS